MAWDNSGDGGGIDALRAQRFNAAGTKNGNEFLVNTTVTNTQSQPSVAALSNGNVTIAWRDDSATGGDTSGAAVRADIFFISTRLPRARW
ncbi:MAG: hypothetical protein Q9M45_02115 [Robiginitomaculum sp.]|nr:hypothetical protein [Robiginitomaculum sp.]